MRLAPGVAIGASWLAAMLVLAVGATRRAAQSSARRRPNRR